MSESSAIVRNARAPARRAEEGVVLVLALFVIMILLVIVPQFRFSASLDRELARNDVQDVQMESLARAAILRAEAALLVDLEDDLSKSDAAGADDGSEFGGDGALGGGGAGGATGSSDGASGSGGSGKSGTHVDSLDEVWANHQLSLSLGEDSGFKTRIVVSDEDAKLNLLLLFAADQEYRTEWRDRFERMIDLMRDGEPEDLSRGEADDLLRRIEKWVEGDRPGDELATAPLASGDWHETLDRRVLAPLSLAELCLSGGIKPTLLHGFDVGESDDRHRVLGLEQGLTVWSNLEYKDPGAEETAASNATVPAAGTNTSQEAPAMNNGRVNVNTAPLCVLKSLFTDNEVPYAAWDQYDEFRKQRLEEIERERKDLENASDAEKKNKRKTDEADEPTYPLHTVDDLRRMDGFSPDSSSVTPENWTKLSSYISVESNVFTITVMIGTRGPSRRFYVARAVVWRRTEGDAPACIPIVPFERIATSAADVADFAKELDEWSESASH